MEIAVVLCLIGFTPARSEPGSAKVPRRLLPAEAGSRSPEHPGVPRRGERVTSWRRWTLLRLVLAFAFGWAGEVGSGQLAIWGRGAAFAGPGEIFTQVSVGGDLVMALRPDGSVVAWGANNAGQCSVPEGLRGVKAIAAGGSHSLALREDGTVVAWGANSYPAKIAGGSLIWGQSAVPRGLGRVRAIAAGPFVSAAIHEPPSKLLRFRTLAFERSAAGDSTCVLTLTGVMPGARYRLEARESLDDEDWVPLGESEATSDLLELRDTRLVRPASFYRARQAGDGAPYRRRGCRIPGDPASPAADLRGARRVVADTPEHHDFTFPRILPPGNR